MKPLGLETQGLHKSFGALAVANDINFQLEHGARHALIGPNGAGKTTFVNLVTGVLRPSAGRILLGGEEITQLSQAARVKRGLARTFQINALFRRLTVIENVTLAISEREGVAGDFFRPAGRYRAVVEEAYALLDSFGLADKRCAQSTNSPMGGSDSSRSRYRLGSSPRSCCSTSRLPAFPQAKPARSSI